MDVCIGSVLWVFVEQFPTPTSGAVCVVYYNLWIHGLRSAQSGLSAVCVVHYNLWIHGLCSARSGLSAVCVVYYNLWIHGLRSTQSGLSHGSVVICSCAWSKALMWLQFCLQVIACNSSCLAQHTAHVCDPWTARLWPTTSCSKSVNFGTKVAFRHCQHSE